MSTYEIVMTKTQEVLSTMEGDWVMISAYVKSLNDNGTGVFARKVGKAPKFAIDFHDHSAVKSNLVKEDEGCIVFTSDAWSSFNPGIGGARMTDMEGNVLVSRDYEDVHTNNYYETVGVMIGILHIIKKRLHTCAKVRLYTDSATVLSWIESGKPVTTRDQKDVVEMICIIRQSLRHNPEISVVKWDTSVRGEIIADYGRKSNSPKLTTGGFKQKNSFKKGNVTW